MTKELLQAGGLPATAETEGARRFVTCRVEGRLYGVPVEQARDMVVLSAVTPIAFAPARVRGAVNLHGRMATVIDVRTALGLGAAPAGSRVGLTVAHEGELYILAVDQAGEVKGAGEGPQPIEPLDIAAIVAPA